MKIGLFVQNVKKDGWPEYDMKSQPLVQSRKARAISGSAAHTSCSARVDSVLSFSHAQKFIDISAVGTCSEGTDKPAVFNFNVKLVVRAVLIVPCHVNIFQTLVCIAKL
jgi:hypothetical protein